MKRFFYLTDSLESADLIAQDLHDAGIRDDDFHILCCDESTLRAHRLPPATLFQRTDVIRFTERGLIVGAMMSLCFAIPMFYLEQFTLPSWLGLSAFCIVVALICGVIGGLAQENYKLQRFHADIEKGRLLILIDTPAEHASLVRRIMARQHQEATLQDVTSTLVNPFAPTLEAKPIRY